MGPVVIDIGGFLPFSTIDFPDTISAVVFCQGCPWRCAYCQNPGLRPSCGARKTAWPLVLGRIAHRLGWLDAVVFSGGEPTTQAGLPAALTAVKHLGFRTGLQTAGACPDVLAACLDRLDWVSLDIKAGRQAHDRVTGITGSGDAAWRSLALIRASGVPFEVHATLKRDLIERDELRTLKAELRDAGIRSWRVNRARSGHRLVRASVEPASPASVGPGR